MHKKLIGALMALAAFAAFAVMPAGASALPTLGETSGSPATFTPLAPGAKVTATNVGNTKFTGAINVECDHAHMTAEVHVNNDEEHTSNITSAAFNGTGTGTDCTGGGESVKVTPSVAGTGHELPWCIQALAGSDSFTVRGNSCTNPSRPITFAFDFTGIGLTCKYKKEGSFTGTFTTDLSGQDAVLTISEQATSGTGEGNNIFCPTSGKLDMSFTLETDGTNIPLYIK
jgi:hypothetical protein